MGWSLFDQMHNRIAKHIKAWQESGEPYPPRGFLVAKIVADVETYATLRERGAWDELRALAGLEAGLDGSPGVRSGVMRYPLPKRTRRVLREEPVPGSDKPDVVYSVTPGGALRIRTSKHAGWEVPTIYAYDFDLMAHALDLRDNPYRTEEVEADEANPWGDDA
jgi:hypothetical protein